MLVIGADAGSGSSVVVVAFNTLLCLKTTEATFFCSNPSFSIYMFEMNRLVSLYFGSGCTLLGAGIGILVISPLVFDLDVVRGLRLVGNGKCGCHGEVPM